MYRNVNIKSIHSRNSINKIYSKDNIDNKRSNNIIHNTNNIYPNNIIDITEIGKQWKNQCKEGDEITVTWPCKAL